MISEVTDHFIHRHGPFPPTHAQTRGDADFTHVAMGYKNSNLAYIITPPCTFSVSSFEAAMFSESTEKLRC